MAQLTLDFARLSLDRPDIAQPLERVVVGHLEPAQAEAIDWSRPVEIPDGALMSLATSFEALPLERVVARLGAAIGDAALAKAHASRLAKVLTAPGDRLANVAGRLSSMPSELCAQVLIALGDGPAAAVEESDPVKARLRLSIIVGRRLEGLTAEDPARPDMSLGEFAESILPRLDLAEEIAFERARASAREVIMPGERAFDIAVLPQYCGCEIVPGGVDGFDPATLVGVPPRYRWARCTGPVLIEPCANARIRVYEGGQWWDVRAVGSAMLACATAKGVDLRLASAGLFAGLGRGKRIVEEPASAVWIEAEGVHGWMHRPPFPFAPQGDATGEYPPGWLPPERGVEIMGLSVRPGGLIRPFGPAPRGILFGHVGALTETGKPGCAVGWDTRLGKGGAGPGGSPGGSPGGTPGGSPGGGAWPGGLGIILKPKPVTVIMWGCKCLRRGEVGTYGAEGSPGGGNYKWTVDDSAIAEIVGPDDGQEVRLKGRWIGKVNLTVTYTLGLKVAQASMGVSVIYQKFTRRGGDDTEMPGLPLIQPSPTVRVDQASVTHKVTEISGSERRMTVELDFRGLLSDALKDILAVDVASGLDFTASLPSGTGPDGGFTDTRFVARRIKVRGPGRSYVRIKARNAIGHVGTDTLEVGIEIPGQWRERINEVEKNLQQAIDNNASADVVAGARNVLDRAWQFGMEFAEIKVGGLAHLRGPDPRPKGSDKWSLMVEDEEDTGVADVATSAEGRSVNLRKRGPKTLRPFRRPREYMLLPKSYSGSEFEWDREGAIKSDPVDAAGLVYIEPCCGAGVPVVSVAIEPLPGRQEINAGAPVALKAKGSPAEILGSAGQYLWSVLAHPPGAQFHFEPDGPTAAGEVKFFTDTAGIYSFRVDYSVAGVGSPWTYAVADAQVVIKVETVRRLERLGPYDSPALEPHRQRALLRERTIAPQPGAEVLVEGKEGSLGQDIELDILCPTELVLSTDLRARVHFADGTVEDMRLHHDGKEAFRARREIHSIKPIDRIHLIGIRYGNLYRRRGDDVWIDIRVRTLAPPAADLGVPRPLGEGPAAPAGAAVSSVMMTSEGDPISSTPEGGEPAQPPIVNLILRARDLGPATATRAFATQGSLPAHCTLVNGNVHVDVPLFAVVGAFGSLPFTISYDSLAATRDAAVRRYKALNQRTDAQIAVEFGPRALPDGWTLPVTSSLFHFIDPDGGLENPILRHCVELTVADGNKLLFEQAETPGTFHVRHPAEALDDDADAALGLVLQREGGRWLLGSLDGPYRRFDEAGRLVEAVDTTAADKIEIEWQSAAAVVKLPHGRIVRLVLEAGLIKTLTPPSAKTWTLDALGDHLAGLTSPMSHIWRFGYTTDGLVDSLAGPSDLPVEIGYYLGGEVEGVAAPVADCFWGRAAWLKQGERKTSIRFSPRTADQVVTIVDAEGHRRRVTFETDRQAGKLAEYADRSAPESWRRLWQVDYRAASKAPTRVTNQMGGEMGFDYSSGPFIAKGHLLTRSTLPTGAVRVFNRDSKGRLESLESTDRGKVAYLYHGDSDRLKSATYPEVETYGPGGKPATFKPLEESNFDARGRPTDDRSFEGVISIYGYDDADLDPHGSGLVTSVTRAGQTWTYKWDEMGRLAELGNPHGFKTTYAYDDDGRRRQTDEGAYWSRQSWDGLGRLVGLEDKLGRKSGVTLSPYGEPHIVSDSAGNKRTFVERDRNGNVTAYLDECGARHVYEDYDALGRWARHVRPDVRRSGPEGLSSAEAPAVEARHVDDPQPFAEAGSDRTCRTVHEIGQTKVTLHRDKAGLPVGSEVEEDGHRRTTVTRYDRYGEVIGVIEFEDGQFLARTLEIDRDELGRVWRSKQGEVETFFGRGRTDRGIHQVELYPAQERQAGGAVSSGIVIDDLGRTIALLDGKGEEVVRYVYDDAKRTMELHVADPSDRSGLSLIPAIRRTYDVRGLLESETILANGPVTEHKTSWARDELSRVSEVADSLGETRTYRYDNLDRIEKVTVKAPGVVTPPLPLDPAATAAATATVTYELSTTYDPAGRVTSTSFADGTSETSKYDLLGRPTEISRTGQGGGTITEQLFYDRRGELRARWYAPATYWLLQRDPDGRTRTEEQHAGTRTVSRTYRFDSLGAVTGYSEQGHGVSFEQSYDGSGRVTRYSLRKGADEVAKVEWRYGSAPAPDSVQVTDREGSRTIGWTYDQDNRMIAVSCSRLTNGNDFTMEFGRAGLLQRIVRPWDPKAVSELAYHPHGGLARLGHVVGEGWEEEWTTEIGAQDYDNRGNPTKVANRHTLGFWDLLSGEAHFDDNFTVEEAYTYDGAGRLYRTDATGDDSRVEREVYFDRAGRQVLELSRRVPDDDDPDEVRRQVVRATFEGQALKRTETSWVEAGETGTRTLTSDYAYDLFGRMLSVTETLDHSGAGGGRWARAIEYGYGIDDMPQTMRIVEWRGAERILIQSVESSFDQSGRLAYSRNRTYARGKFGVEGFWATSLTTAATVADFVGSILSPSGAPLEDVERYYVHAGGDLVSVLDKDGKPVEEYLLAAGSNNRLAVRFKPADEGDVLVANYHFDRRGSSLMLTRTDGEIIEEFSQQATVHENDYRSSRYVNSGMWLDPATGLFQAGARAMRAASGQFLSVDPMGLSGNASLYALPANQAGNAGDPAGSHPVLVIAALIAGNTLLDILIDFTIARFSRSRFDPDRALVENAVLNTLTAGAGLAKLAKLRHTSRFARVLTKTTIRHRRPLAMALELGGSAGFEAFYSGRSFGTALASAALGRAAFAGSAKSIRALAYGSSHLHRMTFNAPKASFLSKLAGVDDLELPGALGIRSTIFMRGSPDARFQSFISEGLEGVGRIGDHFGEEVAAMHQVAMLSMAKGILRCMERLGPDVLKSLSAKRLGQQIHKFTFKSVSDFQSLVDKHGIHLIDDVRIDRVNLIWESVTSYMGDFLKSSKKRPDIAFQFTHNGNFAKAFWDPTTTGSACKAAEKYSRDFEALFIADLLYDRLTLGRAAGID